MSILYILKRENVRSIILKCNKLSNKKKTINKNTCGMFDFNIEFNL